MHVVGSLIDPSQVASSSQTRLEDSESATSPGADSDYYHSSPPDTPADTTGAMSEELSEEALVRVHDMRLRLLIHACGLD